MSGPTRSCCGGRGCRAETRLSAVGRSVWLVRRLGPTARYRALPPDEASARHAAALRRGFASIWTALKHDRNAAQRAAQLLKGWFAEGLIWSIE